MLNSQEKSVEVCVISGRGGKTNRPSDVCVINERTVWKGNKICKRQMEMGWKGKEKGAIIVSCSTGSSDVHITIWNLSLNNMMIKKNPIVVA